MIANGVDDELAALVQSVIRKHLNGLELVLEFDKELTAFAATASE